MSQPPTARASAWRFAFSLEGLRGKEVRRAAITCSIFTLDPPGANAHSNRTLEQLRIRRIQVPPPHATTKYISKQKFFAPHNGALPGLVRPSVAWKGRAVLPQRLHFHFHLNLSVGRYVNQFAASQIFLEHARSQPPELPSILTRHNRVFAGMHGRQTKRSVRVALVSPEKHQVVLRHFRHQHDHDAV